jgi:hypothetical protein
MAYPASDGGREIPPNVGEPPFVYSEICVCVDTGAGESLSCCKDATGPDFLLAFPCWQAAKVIGKKKGTGEERDHAERLGNFDKKESFSKGVDSST